MVIRHPPAWAAPELVTAERARLRTAQHLVFGSRRVARRSRQVDLWTWLDRRFPRDGCDKPGPTLCHAQFNRLTVDQWEVRKEGDVFVECVEVGDHNVGGFVEHVARR